MFDLNDVAGSESDVVNRVTLGLREAALNANSFLARHLPEHVDLVCDLRRCVPGQCQRFEQVQILIHREIDPAWFADESGNVDRLRIALLDVDHSTVADVVGMSSFLRRFDEIDPGGTGPVSSWSAWLATS